MVSQFTASQPDSTVAKRLILFLEPFDTGSHAAWMRGYREHSTHHIELLTMPGNYWQWRMHGGAVTLARLFNESTLAPDLIVASDMLDLTTFLALTRHRTVTIPTILYFHENQLTYPQGPRIKRDLHLGFINYVSALAADRVCFNSQFHMDSFYEELPRLLKHYADFNELQTVKQLQDKSRVLPLGLDLRRFDAYGPKPHNDVPVILWNHRWDYDKGPQQFFTALYDLAERGVKFNVIVAGENSRHQTPEFDEARQRLADRVIHFGYANSFADYARLLWQSDVVVSCATQDFFGISMCEAIYCGCLPVMPDRLNYPDLIPTTLRDLCLYQDDQVVNGIGRALDYLASQTVPISLRESVAQYDWSRMTPIYDSFFG